MNVRIASPDQCSQRELERFERVVRSGFAGSDESLPQRIRAARWLGWNSLPGGEVAAIAGMKAPDAPYRAELFRLAGADLDPDEHEVELGWVVVLPQHRRQGIGTALCRELLHQSENERIFATTRPDNQPMIAILRVLDFAPVGEPYRHARRQEDLTLFVRSHPAPSSVLSRNGDTS